MSLLSTSYLGLSLKSPIIIGSSGLTNSVDKVKKLAGMGVGAVVLKSLFEEQILAETSKSIAEDESYGYDVFDYIKGYTHEHNLNKHLDLIKECKEAVDIPIIASINCVSDGAWVSWAGEMEKAGADALEINLSALPSDDNKDGATHEKEYFDILEKVSVVVNIPIALKISHYNAGLSNFVKRLSWTRQAKGIVMFNRYYNPDIDIDNIRMTSVDVFSSPLEYARALRWVSLLSRVVDEQCDLVATTGFHSGESIIKALLAGAKAVQIASVVYKNGPEIIPQLHHSIREWMQKHNYQNIEQFRSKLAFDKEENTRAFERIQFMRHFGGIE